MDDRKVVAVQIPADLYKLLAAHAERNFNTVPRVILQAIAQFVGYQPKSN